MAYTTAVKLLDAKTADTTGEAFAVGDRAKLSVQFVCADHTSGNGVFTILVSNDGVNFVQYNRLTDNVTNTNAQQDTRVASVTLSSNTSKIYFFAPGDHFEYVKAVLDVTTDGTYSAIMHTVIA